MGHGFYAAGLMGALVAALAAQACILSAPACELCGNTGASSGSGGGMPSVCKENPLLPGSGALIDDCGVFVDANAVAGGSGTKARPFQTLADATEVPNVTRVFVCAGTYTETKPVVFTGG